MLKWPLRLFLILLLVGAGVTVRSLLLGGAFRNAGESYGGTCSTFAVDDETGRPSLVGVEDIVIDHERSVAYLSVMDRRAGDAARGAIYLLPIHSWKPPTLLIDITSGAPEKFQPHGIDLYIGEDGERRLFVVDHGVEAEGGPPRVLIYKVGETGLLEQDGEPVTSEEFVSINDVAAAGPRDFYVTNDVRAKRNSVGQLMAGLFALPRGEVVFYDDDKSAARIVAKGLTYANGVTVDPANNTLYAAELLKSQAHSFRIRDNGDLTPLNTVKTRGGGDNFALDANGDLYLAQHVNIFRFLDHQKDAAVTSPSNVVMFPAHASGDALESDMKMVMETRGIPAFGADTPLSGLSVAAVSNGVMYLGTVFEPRIWRCTADDTVDLGRPPADLRGTSTH